MNSYKGSNVRHGIAAFFCAVLLSTVSLAATSSTIPVGGEGAATGMVA